MIAILIFAGRSKRFWPLTEKSFFRVGGTTLIETQMKGLRAAGIAETLLVAGSHNAAEARALFPSVRIVEQEDLDLGMRGALLSALPHCGDQAVLVVSANDVIDAGAYASLVNKAATLKSGGLILARQVQSYFPGGYLVLDGKRITDIVEKPAQGTEPSSLVNIVAHVHARADVLLDALTKVSPKKDDGYEQALALLFQKHVYEAMPYDGPWQAVKYPWHLLSLLPVLLPQTGKPVIHTTAVIHPSAVIEGPVIISEGVRVMAHATVMGPCFIDAHTVIANNALVRGSSVGRNCVIGYNTEIARSVLADDVWTHSSYVGDSVLGSNISLGAGTTTGNLRLDETEISSVVQENAVPTGLTKFGAIIGDHCRTGIHTCLAPGVKIGTDCFINSMTMVTEDVPNGSFVKSKNAGELVIRPNVKKVARPESRGQFKKMLKNQG